MNNNDPLKTVGEVLLPRWRWLVTAATATGLIFGAAFLVARPYVADSVFIPKSSDSDITKYSGLAAQLGVSLPTSGSSQSLAFYVDLVASRNILSRVTHQSFRTAAGEVRNLADEWGKDLPEPGRTNMAISELRSKIATEADEAAGVVSLQVRDKEPGRAVWINRAILNAVEEFNLERSQSQAKAEQTFTAARMRESEQRLNEAEERLADFLSANRTYLSSPQLTFAAQRMQRKIDVLQAIYQTLASANEQAAISAVRNTPVITVLDPPEGSAHAAHGLIKMIVLGAVIGTASAAAILILSKRERRARRQSQHQHASDPQGSLV